VFEALQIASTPLNVALFMKVGTEFIRGVSGGERKRTNIGMELIISPAVLFLDEPTTGLDASTANAVMSLLHRYIRNIPEKPGLLINLSFREHNVYRSLLVCEFCLE
jgi:ABC-type glutathione transport system ATPase component